MKKIDTNKMILRISLDAILAAIASVLYVFCELPISPAIFPSFLKINPSMIAVIIVAFMIGPWDASLVVCIRMVAKFILKGTQTSGVGEVADLLIGMLTVIPSGIIYNYTNLKHKNLFSFLAIIIFWVLAGVITNLFINIPFYKNVAGFSDEILAKAIGKPVSIITFGLIKAKNITANNYMLYYILFSVIPFNLILSLIVVFITIPIHKRLKGFYSNFNFKKEKNIDFFDEDKGEENSHN